MTQLSWGSVLITVKWDRVICYLSSLGTKQRGQVSQVLAWGFLLRISLLTLVFLGVRTSRSGEDFGDSSNVSPGSQVEMRQNLPPTASCSSAPVHFWTLRGMEQEGEIGPKLLP